MRILHILNHTRRLNGHVHAAVDLACAQVRLGHEVYVASEGGDFDSLLKANGIGTFVVNHRRRIPSLVKALIRLNAHVRDLEFDIVHAHMMTSAVISYPICKVRGVPLITTVHNEFERSATLMGLGTRVIAVSDVVGASMKRRGVSASKLKVVLNGTIGSSRSEGRSEEPKPLRSPSILFVGGLHPRKGLPDLFHAFEAIHGAFPAAHLYVVGDGPYRETYKEMVATLECAEAVTFIGSVSDPYPYMVAADVFVLPSHADPAPLVLSEAREARCAVIGSAVDGIPQLLEHGEAGLLVPPRDPAALAGMLRHLLESPERIASWKQKSQLRIDRLTIERVAKETIEVYRSAMPHPKAVALAT
ncbi:glycosyltransferase family 4 protein [Rhizobiaceae bacterium n13]|uniref:Glycosyltransferase family 4 protein n=1 Tax=Ferirhizobium litorale TaxID=2927786 RepID=A0AAE3QIB0_9HYPH|nr:glycosyltransferase family 4 protein [Fererhizobium litorale]MDI7862977.1 glycosyltransferase family 4 protein [Fererhizobium litorale]MDI7924050.1 glycosyltransferase family 4 protein [Fererhizobium litorale]